MADITFEFIKSKGFTIEEVEGMFKRLHFEKKEDKFVYDLDEQFVDMMDICWDEYGSIFDDYQIGYVKKENAKYLSLLKDFFFEVDGEDFRVLIKFEDLEKLRSKDYLRNRIDVFVEEKMDEVEEKIKTFKSKK